MKPSELLTKAKAVIADPQKLDAGPVRPKRQGYSHRAYRIRRGMLVLSRSA